MKFRLFGNPTGGPTSTAREAQIMIRHPNTSGLQRDQVSHLYIPANFVEELRVWQGDALLFSMHAGISISEDPNFRFTYVSNGAHDVQSRGPRHGGQRVPSRVAGECIGDVDRPARTTHRRLIGCTRSL